jgi:hypothetical protein
VTACDPTAAAANLVGISRDEFLELQKAGQDDETAGLIALTERRCVPILRANRWECRFPGADGLGCWDRRGKFGMRLIHSIARETDGDVWSHLSLSRSDGVMPTWEQTRDVWRLLFDQIAGVIVIPPASSHVSIAEVAHVWGNLSRPTVPDFTHGLPTI